MDWKNTRDLQLIAAHMPHRGYTEETWSAALDEVASVLQHGTWILGIDANAALVSFPDVDTPWSEQKALGSMMDERDYSFGFWVQAHTQV
eukprot:5961078-Prorocentrum_lima.AAC.1